MGYQTAQSLPQKLWALAARQHGVISRRQLLEFGMSVQSIKHRVARGRLHRVCRGVYAVGRPDLTQHGRWMAAVLSCGRSAVLSHQSAAELWGIRPVLGGPVEVSIPLPAGHRRRDLLVHRRLSLSAEEITRHEGIPTTTPVCTLVDVAGRLGRPHLEAAINEADKLGLVNPEELRAAIGALSARLGLRMLRQTLDRRTFRLTDSELERRFLQLVRSAGLPEPQTGGYVNAFKVDFHWPELGLIVETDGLRYHRTPAQQARDRLRDQAHAAAGLTPLRFTHEQIRFTPKLVRATLLSVARRLGHG